MENDINEVLAKKRDWKKGDINRRQKDGCWMDRKLTADCIRIGRIQQRRIQDVEKNSEYSAGMVFLCIILALLMVIIFSHKAHASERITTMDRPNCLPLIHHTCSELADAIYLSEGGSHTKHSYGILRHYKHTDARMACINTIHHNIIRWFNTDQQEPFLHYLARHYAPVDSDTDNGTNQYWLKNVSYWLMREN